MPKIAAIDTGSNAIRLIIANVDENAKVEQLETIRVPVRLGQDVFANHEFSESTIESVVDAFVQFRRIIDDFGVSQVKAVATSAMRESLNKQIVIDRIHRSANIQLEVIIGEEEARLVSLAIASAMQLNDSKVVMVDIGGGSVEITLTNGNNIISTNSYQLGTVRLLQNLVEEKNKITPLSYCMLLRESIKPARRYMEADMDGKQLDFCVGTGGNVEEIGTLCQRLKFSDSATHITANHLQQLVAYLGRMTDRDRVKKLGLRTDRADVILPASIVLDQIVNIAKVNDIYIPNVGLKNGILLDMASSFAQETNLVNKTQVRESALRIGNKYQFDLEHALFVAQISLSIFDQTEPLHQLGPQERLLLEVAATLHDIGHFISTVDHDQHGAYILGANHLIGISENQQKMIAAVVRYHRKGYPYRDEFSNSDLSAMDRLTITKLAAILRIADGLDSSHLQKVTDVRITDKYPAWKMTLISNEDLSYEKWRLSKKCDLFKDIFGQSLEITE